MRISIVIPVCNVSATILECLDSVAAQTWKGDTEVILVDDCGTDDSMRKVTDYVSSYKGHQEYRILEMGRNSGVSAARNMGLRSATGTHVLFIDSDDSIVPQCLEWMVETAESYSGVDMVVASVLGAKDGSFLSVEGKGLPECNRDRMSIAKEFLACRYSITAWNRLVRLDFIRDNQLFFNEGVLYEDCEWLYRLATRLGSVAICHHPTYLYRVNPQGLTGTVSHEKDVLSRLAILESNLDDVSKPYAGLQRRYLLNSIVGLESREGIDSYIGRLRSLRERFVGICPLSWLVRVMLQLESHLRSKVFRRLQIQMLKVIVSV